MQIRDPGADDARRAAGSRLVRANNIALSSAPRRGQAIDPSKEEVFRPGPDGKLHPVDGWTTTGPFDLGRWTHNVDWTGVARDLGTIAAGAMSGAGLPGLLSRRATAGVIGEGLTSADKLTLGAGAYSAADKTLQDVAPKQKPKHW
jgi:hypothetical protein